VKKFRFPFERAMDGRDEAAEKEKRELERLHDVRRGLEKQQETVRTTIAVTATANAATTGIAVEDVRLSALFVASLRAASHGLHREQENCRSAIEKQTDRCVAAERDFKLLARLREKQLSAWTALSHREADDAAAEMWLAANLPRNGQQATDDSAR